MDKISALMDGELDSRECKREIQRLEGDPRLAREWQMYHLIRDAMRDPFDLGPNFSEKLHARLQQEPTVLAPRRLVPLSITRHALPIAASLAGVAVVAWLAQSSPVTTSPTALVAAPATQQIPTQVPVGVVHADVPEYLVAHQEFSPSTAMQGVVSYVRTVSNEESNQNR